jgi:hypothetical protein
MLPAWQGAEKKRVPKMSVDNGREDSRHIAMIVFGLMLLLSTAVPTIAEEDTTPIVKWRPKGGAYASPGVNFDKKCSDLGDVVIDVARKYVAATDVVCKITRLTETTPSTIKLDMTCTDENETPRKEIMLLRRIDDNTFFLRGTQNGKFLQPGEPTSYCPEKMQRIYREQQKGKH